jgi:hypothetical protein
MFIPQEEITIVMDTSGSMLGDPKLLNAFQRIVFAICTSSKFSKIPINFYSLGSSLEKINIENFLSLSDQMEMLDFISNLRNIDMCKIDKLLNIQKPGPKLFLSDGIQSDKINMEKLESEWILTCRSIDVMKNFSNRDYITRTTIPLLDEKWETLEVKTIKKILNKIDAKMKNKIVVCREYESISVL